MLNEIMRKLNYALENYAISNSDKYVIVHSNYLKTFGPTILNNILCLNNIRFQMIMPSVLCQINFGAFKFCQIEGTRLVLCITLRETGRKCTWH